MFDLIYIIAFLITIANATLLWFIAKRLLKENAPSWGNIYLLTFIGSIIFIYVSAHYEFYLGNFKQLLIYEGICLMVTLLSIPLLMKLKNRYGAIINGFLPIAIPLAALFFFLLFNSFSWKVQGSDIYDIPENGIQKVITNIDTCRNCVGFPLPSTGSFYQGNTGEIEVSRLNLTFDFLFYFALAFLMYRILRNRINWQNPNLKLLLFLYCAIAYYFCIIVLLWFGGIDADPYPVNTHILGVHFKFLGAL